MAGVNVSQFLPLMSQAVVADAMAAGYRIGEGLFAFIHASRNNLYEDIMRTLGLNSSTQTPIQYQAVSFIVRLREKIALMAGVPENQLTQQQVQTQGGILLQTLLISTTTTYDATSQSIRTANLKYIRSAAFLGRITSNQHIETLTGQGSSSEINNFLTEVFQVRWTATDNPDDDTPVSVRDKRDLHSAPSNEAQCASVQNIIRDSCYMCSRTQVGNNNTVLHMECEHVIPFLTSLAHLVIYRNGITRQQVLKLEYLYAHRCCNRRKSDKMYIKLDNVAYSVNTVTIDEVLDDIQDKEIPNHASDGQECQTQGLVLPNLNQTPTLHPARYAGDTGPGHTAANTSKRRGRAITIAHVTRIVTELNNTIRAFGGLPPNAGGPAAPVGQINFAFYMLFIKLKILCYLNDQCLHAYLDVTFPRVGGEKKKNVVKTKNRSKIIDPNDPNNSKIQKTKQEKAKQEKAIKKKLSERQEKAEKARAKFINDAIMKDLPEFIYHIDVEGGVETINGLLQNKFSVDIGNYFFKNNTTYDEALINIQHISENVYNGTYKNLDRMRYFCIHINETSTDNYTKTIYNLISVILNTPRPYVWERIFDDLGIDANFFKYQDDGDGAAADISNETVVELLTAYDYPEIIDENTNINIKIALSKLKYLTSDIDIDHFDEQYHMFIQQLQIDEGLKEILSRVCREKVLAAKQMQAEMTGQQAFSQGAVMIDQQAFSPEDVMIDQQAFSPEDVMIDKQAFSPEDVMIEDKGGNPKQTKNKQTKNKQTKSKRTKNKKHKNKRTRHKNNKTKHKRKYKKLTKKYKRFNKTKKNI